MTIQNYISRITYLRSLLKEEAVHALKTNTAVSPYFDSIESDLKKTIYNCKSFCRLNKIEFPRNI